MKALQGQETKQDMLNVLNTLTLFQRHDKINNCKGSPEFIFNGLYNIIVKELSSLCQ